MKDTKPDWILGAPPCTPFSIWNHGINFKKMDAAKVKALIAEGLVHLRFVCSLYRMQMARSKFFLHEHPASAVSWREDEILALVRHPTTHLVTMHQCQYGLVTPSKDDPAKLVPA